MKELTINAINNLLESECLMSQMSNLVMQLGGDFWESPYSKAHKYHSDTVFAICTKDAKNLNDEEKMAIAQDVFFECIFQLARRNPVDIEIEDDNGNLCDVIRITTAEDMYNYFTKL